MKKKYLVFAILLLQLAFLSSMILFHQQKITKATRILLETVPVDPQSVFRGYYAQLRYKISSIPLTLLKDASPKDLKAGGELFVLLKKQGDYWQAEAMFSKKPKKDGNVYLRGRIPDYYSYSSRWMERAQGIELEYGIESFFLSQESSEEVGRRNVWQERLRQRGRLLSQLDAETRRIEQVWNSRDNWSFKKFDEELQVLEQEGIIDQETKEKIQNKYAQAFERIKALEATLTSEEKPIIVEIAVDSKGYGFPTKLLFGDKVYQ